MLSINQIPSNIKGLVFDIGNVLVPYDELSVIETIAQSSELTSLKDIHFHLFRSSAHRSMFRGEYSPVRFFRYIKDQLRLDLSLDQFLNIFKNVFIEPNAEMVNLLIDAKDKGFKIALLSNIDVVCLHRLCKLYYWMSLPNTKVTSCGWGALKPNNLLFEKVEQGLKLRPEDLLYFDDLENNIISAKKKGWHAEQYIAPQTKKDPFPENRDM